MFRKALIFIISVIQLSLASHALAQQAGGKEEKKKPALEMNIGVATVEGRSKIDRTSPIYHTGVLIGEFRITGQKYFFKNNLQRGPGSFGGISTDIMAESTILSIGPTRFGFDIRYFYAQDKDVVWNDGLLVINGETTKQYGLLGFNGGIGDYHKRHVRIFTMAGLTKMDKFIESFGDGHPFDGNPTLVDRNLLPIMDVGFRIRLPDVSRTDIDLAFNHIRTFNGANKKLITPENQTMIDGSANFMVNKHLGVGIFGTWSNHDNGIVFLGNSYGIKTSFKF